jgi:hypothetical protein
MSTNVVVDISIHGRLPDFKVTWADAYVVDGHRAVFQVMRERRPVLERVVDGSCGRAAIGHAPTLKSQPGAKLVPQRPRQCLPPAAPSLIAQATSLK